MAETRKPTPRKNAPNAQRTPTPHRTAAQRRTPTTERNSTINRTSTVGRTTSSNRTPETKRTLSSGHTSATKRTPSANRTSTANRASSVKRASAAGRNVSAKRTSASRGFTPRPQRDNPIATKAKPVAIVAVSAIVIVILLVNIVFPTIGSLFSNASHETKNSQPDTLTTASINAAAASTASSASTEPSSTPDSLASSAQATAFAAAKASAPPATVSFVAVGDNLPDDYIGYYADSLAGEMDDGAYEYAPMYRHVAGDILLADLSYIDQEVHLGGDDIGPQGYPSFNVTDSMADTLALLGFDFVATATNHSYDWAYDALAHSVSVLDSKRFAFTGTATTQEQYERIVTRKRDGITFALLNYTYGVNAYSQSDLPQYAVNFIDDARITSDVQRAHEIADVVLVSMHWGTELLEEADEEQLRLAQLLADLDVDVVLGSHPHVIGPMSWVKSSTNPEHRTLVCYSLGNFLADHEAPLAENLVEGMLKCDFVRAETGGEVTVENVRWVPLVCYSTDDRWNFAVYPVEKFPVELAKQCRTLTDMDDPIGWLMSHSKAVVGEEWF